MAMNLRLDPEIEAALRAEARRSGRSQQEIVRSALARLLGKAEPKAPSTDQETLIASGLVKPPRRPYQRVKPILKLEPGTTSLDLLDRDDRI